MKVRLYPTKAGHHNDDWPHKCHNCLYMYPEGRMVKRGGNFYCNECYGWKFSKLDQDRVRIRVLDEPKGRK
ncbi:MAG: hypothetical protein ACYS1A_20500 [Planctomycetota bacterium]|jgi:hypothetical protein